MSAPSLFGVIIPSRPVQTAPVVVSPTQFAFTFPSTPSFTHIIVFLLPGITIPGDAVAAIYAQLPGTAPEFKLLGALSNDKQSAIFKINGGPAKNEIAVNGVSGNVAEDDMIDVDTLSNTSIPLSDTTVGISIEPASTILPQLASLIQSNNPSSSSSSSVLIPYTAPSSALPPPNTKLLAQRIIKNAFNFLASFAGTTAAGGQEVVPLRSFKDWWTKFERRIENDPGFLEREGDG